jgi:hypothetical protein
MKKLFFLLGFILMAIMFSCQKENTTYINGTAPNIKPNSVKPTCWLYSCPHGDYSGCCKSNTTFPCNMRQTQPKCPNCGRTLSWSTYNCDGCVE